MAKYVNKACCLVVFLFSTGIQLFLKISKPISFGYSVMVPPMAGTRVNKRKSAYKYSTSIFKNFLNKIAGFYFIPVSLGVSSKMMLRIAFSAKSTRWLLNLECTHFCREYKSYVSGNSDNY